jgi:hypothetical protein
MDRVHISGRDARPVIEAFRALGENANVIDLANCRHVDPDKLRASQVVKVDVDPLALARVVAVLWRLRHG